MGSVSEASEFEGSFVWSLIGCFVMPCQSENLRWFGVISSYYPMDSCFVYQNIKRDKRREKYRRYYDIKNHYKKYRIYVYKSFLKLKKYETWGM